MPGSEGGAGGTGSGTGRADREYLESLSEYKDVFFPGEGADAEDKPPAPTRHHGKKHHGAPEGHHGGSGFEGLLSGILGMYNELIASLLNASNEPNASDADGGTGFEDTVLTRRVLGPGQLGVRSLFSLRGGPQRRVIDPITGQIYVSPEAAMQAGVTSYQYLPLPTQEGGGTQAGTVSTPATGQGATPTLTAAQ